MDFTQFTLTQLLFSHRVSPDVSAGQCLKFCDSSAAMLPNLFKQDGAPAHRSRHTVAYLRSNVPEFIEAGKLAAIQPESAKGAHVEFRLN